MKKLFHFEEDNDPINFISDKPYRWMSNFRMATIRHEGISYPSVEHAYQASKTLDSAWALAIRESSSPVEAKKLGRQAPMREDWMEIRVAVMSRLVQCKFLQHSDMAEKLLATGSRPIREDSPWDSFWGTGRDGNGRNEMGKIIMAVREQLKGRQ